MQTKEYFIEGPGVLASDLRATGGPVRLHLRNCHLSNCSPIPVDEAGIRYVFEGNADLNFTALDEDSTSGKMSAVCEGFDAKYDEIRFRGPLVKSSRDDQREHENRLGLDL